MPDYKKFSKNSSINSLIEKILDELCPFLEAQAEEISQLTSIGKALGLKKNISELLEIILAIAGAHHEKLDGSRYPLHLKKENLNLQARILAIADIFEALSALDRPYKKPKTLNQTIKVLEQMGKNKLLDSDIIKFFLNLKRILNMQKPTCHHGKWIFSV